VALPPIYGAARKPHSQTSSGEDAEEQASDAVSRGLALSSTFGAATPMFIDQPVFPGRPDALSYAVDLRGRIYYPRSLEQEQFLENPLDFIGIPRPSLVPVHPAVVVSGPPLVGKTALARSSLRIPEQCICPSLIYSHICVSEQPCKVPFPGS